MEKLPRFVIYLGIGIGVTLFGMLLFSAIPGMIQYTSSDWDRMINEASYQSDEKLLEMFEEHPAYIAFYETYPDAKQDLNSRGQGDGNLQVGIMNFDTNNQLLLEMYYDKWNYSVNVNVRCNIMEENGDRNRDLYADGLFAEDFIRNVKCLDRDANMIPNVDSPVVTTQPKISMEE